VNLREFNRNDWMAYSGAENGVNGEEPLIAEMEVDWMCLKWGVTILVDLHGIVIYYSNEEADDEWYNNGPWFLCECSMNKAKWIIEHMEDSEFAYHKLKLNPFFVEDEDQRIRKGEQND